MYLKKDSTYNGLNVPNAVFKVEYVTIQNGQLDFFVSMRAAVDALILTGETHGCIYDPDGINPEKQAYAYLKTLPEYSSAVEVTD